MLKSASYVTDKHVQDLSVPMYNSVSACSTSAFVSCFIDEKYLHFLCTLSLFCLFSSLLHSVILKAWLSKVLFVSFTANPICFISIETGCG